LGCAGLYNAICNLIFFLNAKLRSARQGVHVYFFARGRRAAASRASQRVGRRASSPGPQRPAWQRPSPWASQSCQQWVRSCSGGLAVKDDAL
jgi:hypothetical protein